MSKQGGKGRLLILVNHSILFELSDADIISNDNTAEVFPVEADLTF